MTAIPRLVIAAPYSGSGKTTLAVGLMAALAESRRVQAFKVGPDYIDPMYHHIATGRPSRNLDTWMIAPAQVKALFARATADADIAIIEGVMGLFDGYEGASETGSTAEVAKLLGAPVILVMDVSRMARSAGAMALGYKAFDTRLNIAGVIANHAASAQHARWVTQAIESAGLRVLGCVPRDERLRVPERHLGLRTAVERQAEARDFAHQAAQIVRSHLNVEELIEIARSAAVSATPTTHTAADRESAQIAWPPAHTQAPLARIAVARDEAFCFYYEDNLDLLRSAGAEIVYFSPLRDADLPPGTQGVYLGGGYPELYAEALAANNGLRSALQRAHQANQPIYAECGGLMALVEQLIDLNGRAHPMFGLIPGVARMQARLTMGYREVVARRDTLLLRAGQTARGHEFHYSAWEAPDAVAAEHAYEIAPRTSGHDSARRAEGFARGNLLASYVHLHFAAHPDLAWRFVNACQQHASP
ncbi:MAG: cobyrinate a,c-diamide synthase [Anaerolineae bacterium]